MPSFVVKIALTGRKQFSANIPTPEKMILLGNVNN